MPRSPMRDTSGSASIYLELVERGRRRTVALSGDLGNAGRPLLRAPRPPPKCDVVVMETTYGDRHTGGSGLGRGCMPRSRAPSPAAATSSFRRLRWSGPRASVPSARRRGRRQPAAHHAGLPGLADGHFSHQDLPAPPRVLRRRSARTVSRGRDPFVLPGLHFVRTAEESMAINRVVGGAVILAGSGMCTADRSVIISSTTCGAKRRASYSSDLPPAGPWRAASSTVPLMPACSERTCRCARGSIRSTASRRTPTRPSCLHGTVRSARSGPSSSMARRR